MFKGDFNGNNNTIYNIHIDKIETGNYGSGLFGIASGKISNLTVTGTIKGGSRVGGIVGWARNNCVISNCYNLCNVYGEMIGGVAGNIDGKTIIINCCNMGNIQATNGERGAGGIVGTSAEGEVINCYNLKPVEHNSSKGSASAGGIIGHTQSQKSVIINSYNIGKITGTKKLGSIVGGYLYNNWISTLEKCYYLENSYSKPVGRKSKHNRGNNFMHK